MSFSSTFAIIFNPGYGASLFVRHISPRLSEENYLFVFALKWCSHFPRNYFICFLSEDLVEVQKLFVLRGVREGMFFKHTVMIFNCP